MFLRVLVDGLRIREEPDTSSRELAQLRSGDIVSVKGRPVLADRLQWVEIRHGDDRGWVATGDGADAWLGQPSPPSEEVVMRVRVWRVGLRPHSNEAFVLFADGRLVTPDATGWIESRLTRFGMTALTAEAEASGLLTLDRILYSPDPGFAGDPPFYSVEITTEAGTIGASAIPPSSEPEGAAVIGLVERLGQHASWLPSAAWVDIELAPERWSVRAYDLNVQFTPGGIGDLGPPGPPSYLIDVDDAQLPLPAPLPEIGDQVETEAPVTLRCAVLGAADALTLREALYELGYPESASDFEYSFALRWAAGNSGFVYVRLTPLPPGEPLADRCFSYVEG